MMQQNFKVHGAGAISTLLGRGVVGRIVAAMPEDVVRLGTHTG